MAMDTRVPPDAVSASPSRGVQISDVSIGRVVTGTSGSHATISPRGAPAAGSAPSSRPGAQTNVVPTSGPPVAPST